MALKAGVRGHGCQIQQGAAHGGRSLGQFSHPYLAAGYGHDIYVADVLNGRVRRVTPRLKPSNAIGGYGADLGELYRPMGVAADDDAVLWVADSDLAVVQAFSTSGNLLDVVRDQNSTPLHFITPTGLARSGDDLYVVESIPGRVVKLQVQVNSTRQPASSLALFPGEPRECSSCHMELLPRLAQGMSTVLTAPPPSSAQQPAASREQACLSCHDGSVEDSRRSVWLEHGHDAKTLVPEGMEVSDLLPLVDGKQACRTCHSAHTEGGSGHTCRDALFLRVSTNGSELCIACHGDMNDHRTPMPENGAKDPGDDPSGSLRPR